MITTIDNQKYYDSFKINSNINYNFNENHLEKIIVVLNQSRQTMVVPTVAHFCIYITSDFDVKTLMPRVKRVLEGVPLAYVYSLERSNKLHIHLMLVLDTARYDDPDVLFIDTVMPAINNLKHVMNDGCVINLRNNKDSYYHDLLDLSEFEDAIERYSYYAKTNQKKYVPTKFKKAFNTSQIKRKKYYDLSESNNMKVIKIDKTVLPDSINVLNDILADGKYLKVKSSPLKVVYKVQDKINKHQQGFYGLSYRSDISESELNFYIMLDFYFSKVYVDTGWDQQLYSHLSQEVKKTLSNIKNNLRNDQALFIHVDVPKSPELQDLLSFAVKRVCRDLLIAEQF